MSLLPKYQIIESSNGNTLCIVGQDPMTRSTIPPDQFLPVSLPSGSVLTYPTVGMVSVVNTADGRRYTTFITADANGHLSYNFATLLPGAYTLVARVYYLHPLDAVRENRVYDALWDGATTWAALGLVVIPEQQSRLDIELRSNANPCESNGP